MLTLEDILDHSGDTAHILPYIIHAKLCQPSEEEPDNARIGNVMCRIAGDPGNDM